MRSIVLLRVVRKETMLWPLNDSKAIQSGSRRIRTVMAMLLHQAKKYGVMRSSLTKWNLYRKKGFANKFLSLRLEPWIFIFSMFKFIINFLSSWLKTAECSSRSPYPTFKTNFTWWLKKFLLNWFKNVCEEALQVLERFEKLNSGTLPAAKLDINNILYLLTRPWLMSTHQLNMCAESQNLGRYGWCDDY